MTTQDPNPLSTWYMESVLEERPTVAQRTGPRIFDRFLPLREYSTYRIVWEKIRDYSPMAGAYALTDLANVMDELDFSTYQADVMHWATRMTLDVGRIQFLRFAGQTDTVNASGYGVGPAADDYRARDAALISKYTKMQGDAMDNMREYLRIKALLGRVLWPPRKQDGTEMTAAELPLAMGRQQVNQPYPFLAASGTTGGFHQAATTLVGISGDAGTQVAWNASTADPIYDMSLVSDLLDDRMSISVDNLLVLMAPRVLSKIANLSGVLDWILGKNRDRMFSTVTELRDFFSAQFEWTIQKYNSKWEYVAQNAMDTPNPTINQVDFMTTGTVLILPQPEVYETGVLATCPAPGPAHNWQGGQYLWMHREEKPPWTTEMGMGGFYFPIVFDTDVRFRLDAWS